MKKILCIFIALIMVMSSAAVAEKPETESVVSTTVMPAESETESAFPSWNADAPSLKTLIEYVDDVTDETSLNYIPPEERIATFDMDGTLMGELMPTYLCIILLMHRIFDDPTYTPDADMVAFGKLMRDHALDKSFPEGFEVDFSCHEAVAFAGMTLNEYVDYITRFILHEVDGFENLTYTNAYYLPMAEVVEYLQGNGFICYIVSGSDRFLVRTFVEGILDIPSENIIGSDVALEAGGHGAADGYDSDFAVGDTVVRTDELLIKAIKANKVIQIAQDIGRPPVISFGNSSGDTGMHNYTLGNSRYRSAAFQLIADDDVRDYGNSAKGMELRKKWESMGYTVISMRDDWKTIYGENVIRTGRFRWLEDYADDRIGR